MNGVPVGEPDAVARAIEIANLALDSGCSAAELATRLYGGWFASAIAESDAPADLPDDLAAVLRAAHAGNELWEADWIVERVGPAAEAVARRGHERRALERCDYVVAAHPGIAATPGARLLATGRRDSLDGAGWWYTHSAGWRLDAPSQELVRLYWNVGAGNAATVIGALSALLTDSAIEWMLKCAVTREAYARADVVVLYLGRDTVEALAGRLEQIRARLAELLREGAPPLTLRVGRGLAACDDPGTGESFGQHRSRLIAGGVLRARSSGPGGRRDRACQLVAERFREEGIPIERPYLADPARSLPWE